ncbi:sensor histidine kinase [Capillimicrobium parvum]|uniref:histidine kinase n=1 Tax=Capillimicrobium parvum TaxID=2884022 RepID=A0A9E6Y1W0_9ACTN|nr:histidine kinase [Capillimicrobium parvum]UGS38657.1 hypothetical protein DSM104329_05087 [Capillimicrobium parvum]
MGIALPMSARAGGQRHRRAPLLVAGALATGVATAITVALTVAAAPEHPAGIALARALSVAAPCAVGLYAWYRRDGERFGLALLATGALLFVTSLAESRDPVLYTVGRTMGWVVEIGLVFLVLSYPTGRLRGTVDRALVVAVGCVALLTFLPRLVLAQQFSVPSPYASCVNDCPDNALFLLDHEPALVVDILATAGVAGVAVVMLAVIVRLWQRLEGASPLARSMFGPVLLIAMARVALLAAGISLRDADASVAGLQLVSWLLALLVPALALAFLVGLVRWRMFAGRAILRLAECLPGADGRTLQRAFAEAFRDPGLQLAFPAPRGAAEPWCDADGRPLPVPPPGSSRMITTVSDGHRAVAALVHDAALMHAPAMLRAGTAIAGSALGLRQLAAEADAAMREVRRSRARIADSTERERQRIERDLHDGAQQRLVALRIELELAENLIRRDPERGAQRVHELEGRVDDAIDELRALAHGIYPPVLSDRGLAEALRTVAARTAVPVSVQARDVGRYPAVVESTVYFSVLEALQNVLKHAEGVHRVQIELDGVGGQLAFAVRDDGAGMPDGHRPGRGIANMRERMATVGGTVSIVSTPRVGTVVQGRIADVASEAVAGDDPPE